MYFAATTPRAGASCPGMPKAPGTAGFRVSHHLLLPTIYVVSVTAVTPRAGASCLGTPKAPGTAGRLPAQWHSKKMQELDSLQVKGQ
jgi:hypothetical protein